MFRRISTPTDQWVTIIFEKREIQVPKGDSVAAAVLANQGEYTRTSVVGQTHRAPYCQMGICFECLMKIDGIPNQQACLIEVREGMKVERQYGTRGIND
ncbi:MAG: (2Fe-2S)-binding protein [Deltaproteobacteria bacterium]|nr:(2Fe-2S)-binding protein [Deltaproteobacteria bacterium]MBT4642944.1 (2Fe-2S)-binding protein [Deltaproteobacteria bacterium]MBT6498972.1 (2Fe-2S)-binding protein [Deltaproteobacteria bacterium]MBT6615569.1 (2Fe-2S)-binding protein [Deltaproteobacteria bacterium]MBT7155490.1 (2Fe-2S)-binding protein [Deltaproteobacteria bacterium]